jgi:AcrR family transcriptional regulator
MPRVIKHPDVRRTEMLDRAFAFFLQRGYDNVSLNDLIADAGVSKGAFYHWFPSKDALIAAVAERSARDQLAAVEHVLAKSRGDALARLNAVLQTGFDVKIATGARQSTWPRWHRCCATPMRTCTRGRQFGQTARRRRPDNQFQASWAGL